MALRSALILAGVTATFVAATLALYQPTPEELRATLPAYGGAAADPLLLTWAIGHVSRALPYGLGAVFDGRVFHPVEQSLALGDHMIGQALLGLPVWWATGNPVLEYNVLALASYPALAVAMTILLRAGAGLPWLACVAGGLAAAFTPFRFHSPLWLQVLWTAFVPLALLAWHRFATTVDPRAWVAWVACWTMHSLLGLYLMLYFAVVMGALVVWGLVAAPARRRLGFVAGAIAGPIATGLALLPVVQPYVTLRAAQGNVRPGGLDTALAFLLPGPGTLSAALSGLGGPASFGPGLVAWGLALTGAVVLAYRLRTARPAPAGDAEDEEAVEPPPDPDRFFWTTQLLGLGVVLALMFVPIALQHRLPLFDMSRMTNRAFLIGLVFLGALVARGAAAATRRLPPALAAIAGVVLLAALAVDAGRPPRERKPIAVGTDLSPAIAYLAALPGDPVVYEHAGGPDGLATAMYHSLFHGRRIPTGYSGFIPLGGSFANAVLFRFPELRSLEVMQQLGVEYVWAQFKTEAHLADARARLADTPVRIVERFGNEAIFDVRHPLPAIPRPRAARPVPREGWRLEATAGTETLDRLRDTNPWTTWHHPWPAPRTLPAVTVDLGSPRAVAAITVATPRAVAERLASARVELSRDGEHWTLVEPGLLPVPFLPFFTNPPEIVTLTARGPTRAARFVRVSSPELAFWGGTWDIGELEILEEPIP